MFDFGFKPVNLTEFNKLKDMLDKYGIKYETEPRAGGRALAIPNYEAYSVKHDGNRTVSVICFNGTYGFEQGLLEVYAAGLNDGVEGYLTAEQAYEYILDTLAGKTRNSIG